MLKSVKVWSVPPSDVRFLLLVSLRRRPQDYRMELYILPAGMWWGWIIFLAVLAYELLPLV